MSDFPARLRQCIDRKTKPVGSLGMLEDIAFQIASLQNTLRPVLTAPTIVVFAGDHGAANAGVSSYPQDVTHQMVMNFLDGGAGINVFCNTNGIDLKIVDSGVNFDFPRRVGLIDEKIARSTRSYLNGSAMTQTQLEACLLAGERVIDDLHRRGTNIVGLGDMGIGNTAAASLIMSTVCGFPIEGCIGRGAGADAEQLARKTVLLKRARERHPGSMSALSALRAFGGFEIAQIAGAMLAAGRRKMVILVDGFISTTAYLVAGQVEAAISGNAIFSHLSDEHAHRLLLDYLDVRPVLQLSMRLGEGSGCAMAYPIVRCAVAFLNDMASFEDAGVSGPAE